MDQNYTQVLTEVGASLTTMAVKGTVTAINTRVKALKVEKDAEKVRNAYDEIVNELISEREEAIRIAQTYKAELDRIEISDEDIEHLHNTVARILEIIKTIQIASAMLKGPEEVEKVKTQVGSYEQMKELISVDTLKTMQLLGFNYKAAIGEPLTEICANTITNWGNKNKNSQTGNKNRK